MQIHILIVDDTTTDAAALSHALYKEEPGYSISVAPTIKEGMQAVTEYIDVILLSAKLLDENGISFIQHIVHHTNASVLIISDASVREAAKTVSALAAGAVDYIRKQEMDQAFITTIIMKITAILSSTRSIYQKLKHDNRTPTSHVHQTGVCQRKKNMKLIAIGTSTGGPRALQQVLQSLPENFNIPILIVQHMPRAFTKKLAERLNQLCAISVTEAIDGEMIVKGRAYIAPGNYHLLMREEQGCLHILLEQGRDELPHRPSVDVLFESLAKVEGAEKIAVVLTGMGKDGKNGILTLKKSDPHAIIIAESPETAVVDGMPKAAIGTEFVTDIIPIDKIAQVLRNID